MSGLNGQFNARLQKLEKGGSSGGSGLPEYTSADKGKVLTVGESVVGSLKSITVNDLTDYPVLWRL